MMERLNELGILAIIIAFSLVLYYGVEPLAHSMFYPPTLPANFNFNDLEDLHLPPGDPTLGKEIAQDNCASCHGILSAGLEAPLEDEDAISAFGVVPPDLSSAGAIYSPKYLANLVVDPTKTVQLSHKFNEDKDFPMGPSALEADELAHLMAYLLAISKVEPTSLTEDAQADADKGAAGERQYSGRDVFIEACSRCHSIKYDGILARTDANAMSEYLGAKAPDLSMMIRSKGRDNLDKFINEPQKTLENAAMPRVGLNEVMQKKLIDYIENVGDSKKEEREFVGKLGMGFMFILAILSYFWKQKIWRELH